jgi:hypothetical protein
MAKSFKWTPSKYVHGNAVKAAMDSIVQPWLIRLSQAIIASAKNLQPRFGMVGRSFWAMVWQDLGYYIATVYVKGKYVDKSAFDNTFTVPVGGFKFGDVNPITGDLFPGGYNKRGSYIALEDKLAASGEAAIPYRARVYNSPKWSGKTVTKLGFLSESIRFNVGSGIMLSPVGKTNLEDLALRLSVSMADNTCEQVADEARRMGYTAVVGPQHIIT